MDSRSVHFLNPAGDFLCTLSCDGDTRLASALPDASVWLHKSAVFSRDRLLSPFLSFRSAIRGWDADDGDVTITVAIVPDERAFTSFWRRKRDRWYSEFIATAAYCASTLPDHLTAEWFCSSRSRTTLLKPGPLLSTSTFIAVVLQHCAAVYRDEYSLALDPPVCREFKRRDVLHSSTYVLELDRPQPIAPNSLRSVLSLI